MTIKNMIMAGLVCCGFTAAFTSCSNDTEAFFTVSEDDAPRILNDDLKSSYEVNCDEVFVLDILVTPADMTTIRWYDGDRLVYEGRTLNQAFEAGDYKMKIVATTVRGKETYRSFDLTVKSIDGDPVATSEDVSERVVKAGQTVKLHGDNLSDITMVSLGGRKIPATYIAGENCVEYTLPADMANGTYRVSLIDNQGKSYGGGKQSIVTKPTCYKSSFSGSPDGGNVAIEGIMLDQITSITVDGKACEIKSKSESKLVVAVPAMAEGGYDLVGTTANGTTMQFCEGGELITTGSYRATSETTLWEGGVDINWGSSNVQIDKDKFADIAVGATIAIYFQIVDMPENYHALRVTTPWWDADYVAQVDGLSQDQSPYTFTYSAADKANVERTGGMLFVGYGYKLTKVTCK